MRNLTILVLLFIGQHAAATVINFSGTFSAEGGRPLSPFGPDIISSVPGVSGEWTASFDDDVVLGVGLESYSASVSSFSMLPSPLGSTTFDASNTIAVVDFFNGELSGIRLGGESNGTGILTALDQPDDFWLAYIAPTTSLFSVAWKLETEGNGVVVDIFSGGTLTGSLTIERVTSLPEPASLSMLGAALIGASLLRFRRRSRHDFSKPPCSS